MKQCFGFGLCRGSKKAAAEVSHRDSEMAESEVEAERPDWTSLPLPLLVLCFDSLITCPSAHPSYLQVRGWEKAS